jgi:glutaconate CoA-transferase subunit B
MSGFGDLMTAVLAREFVAAAANDGVRVVAITTTSSLVAALAAQRLGARELAIAPGFGTLDASPRPSLSLGEAALKTAASPKGPISDTFVAVSRGLVGVVVVPAQLDAVGAINLSFVGGTRDSPRVALPGSRGLPDNNDSPSRVWYLVPDHSPRTLVDRVDFSSGPAPSPGRTRRLITRMGIFQLEPGEGWRATALAPGINAGDVADAGTFAIGVPGHVGEIAAVTAKEAEILASVDPDGLRSIEFDGKAGAELAGRIIERERASRSPSRE